MRRLAALLLAGIAAGCSPSPAPSPPASTPATPRASDTKVLALADPKGSTDVDTTIRAIEQRIGSDPAPAEAWIELARQWIRKARRDADPGFYLNADAAVTLALERSPGDPRALNVRCLALLNSHRFKEARDVAKAILEKAPEDSMAMGSLSDAALELGDLDEALHAALQMETAQPNLPAEIRVSHLHWVKGDIPRARAALQAAMDVSSAADPEPAAFVLVDEAMISWHEGQYEDAQQTLDRALALLPDYVPALVGKGRVALSQRRGADAVTVLERAVATAPTVEALWLLGDARAMAGNADGARDAYARVQTQGRQSDRRTLALFWSARNENADEALKLIEEERVTRGGVSTDDTYAFALLRKGRIADARVAMDRALAPGTRDASLWFHDGLIRVAAGDAAAGREQIRKATALNPGFDAAGAAEAEKILGPER
ncbi:MAG: tetratricopeptide repeat protein [Acidobacteriota bacterium]